MTELILKSLNINNFRSIRGQMHAPLDAKVVLVHGENGAGKTSLLSAVELALTGKVQSLEHADRNYGKQLLHRSASQGDVLVRTMAGTLEQRFEVTLTAAGAKSVTALDKQRATFFRERVFLPQSLLSQLLQIYQDSGNDVTSPLALFVAELLGLDRLDAIEAGLKPLADVRNVRKIVDGWLGAENEKSRLDLLLTDQRKRRDELIGQIRSEINEIEKLCTLLNLPVEVREETLDEVAAVLSDDTDSKDFDLLTDHRRRLSSIRREIDAAQIAINSEAAITPESADEARKAYGRWETEYGDIVSALRRRAEALLPDVSLPSDPEKFSDAALARLRMEKNQLSERTSQVRADIARRASAKDELDVALRRRKTIDDEASRLASNAGSLGSALSELTSFITDETCPVCDRNFTEVSKVPLNEHVHSKVQKLSASAERLLVIGRTRSEVQVAIERLNREIEMINARSPEEETLAQLDRRLASVEDLINELMVIAEALREGGRLRAADIAARRAVSDIQARHVSLASASDTLNDFALSIGAPALGEGDSFEIASARLDALLAVQAAHLEERLSMRRKGGDHIATLRSNVARRNEADQRISADFASAQRVEQALERAQTLRNQGNMIRGTVDKVRSAIIRKEFNDRLNRVWRDLFVRLAPGEPFVPAFRIPESSTQKLQPKLITENRKDGNAGGTPGAMLSAGNLNTAALTLFIALHLSVPEELPWLILDDPVQSMDDIHIAQFAALLRTLSKEHKRQVVIAVHDRQLFEYLRLELSPAFPDDSLLTLELSRGPHRDSVCVSKRFSFKQETALFSVA
ncbi:MAG: AAA family ATPase [Chromatiaceae bacterium]|nr:AAA family ATPase [Chromatiaceae bacterium]MCP5439817.1 AAA family ATPase [Chromatiaceae bacterium]